MELKGKSLQHRRNLFFKAGLLICAACAVLGMAGCSKQPEPQQASDGTLTANVDVLQFRQPEEDALIAVFDTSLGEFSAILYPQQAPQAVQDFVTLARDGAYDGLDFHRVIQDFIIQSGATDDNGGQSIWGTGFPAETSDLLHHYTGALAMAGGEENQSQFFVVNCQQDSVPSVLQEQMRQLGWDEKIITAYAEVGGAPYLDNTYTVFGQVFYGMGTVQDIGNLETNAEDTPLQPAVLNSVTIQSFSAWKSSHPDAQPAFYQAEAQATATSEN